VHSYLKLAVVSIRPIAASTKAKLNYISKSVRSNLEYAEALWIQLIKVPVRKLNKFKTKPSDLLLTSKGDMKRFYQLMMNY